MSRLMIGLAALLSVLASASGIFIAIFCTHIKEDATRGGVIGTAFALIFVVLTRSYGIKVYDAARLLDNQTPRAAPYTVDDVVSMIETLRAAIIVDAEEVKKLNWWMIATTVIAAIAVGFGDKIAALFLS